MSSTPPSPASTITTTTTTQAAPTPKPSAPAISFLPSQPARIYSFVHPLLLLGLLALRFNSLVSDPVTELLNDLPLLALLQVGYVMTCLPPAGSGHPTKSGVEPSGDSASEEKRKGNPVMRPGKAGYRRRHAKGETGGFSVKLIVRAPSLLFPCLHLSRIRAKLTRTKTKQPALLSLTLIFLLATPVLSILLVLFGAPLTTHNFETVLCAAHMAVLSATGLIYVHGVDGSVWKEVWGIARPADGVWGGALGTGVGAWFGAVPIPLDWYVSRPLPRFGSVMEVTLTNAGTVHGKPSRSPF